jgi:hypothetical protein
MKLIIELGIDNPLAIALRRRAQARDLSNEAAAIEVMTTTLQAMGELEQPIASRPHLRLLKPDSDG